MRAKRRERKRKWNGRKGERVRESGERGREDERERVRKRKKGREGKRKGGMEEEEERSRTGQGTTGGTAANGKRERGERVSKRRFTVRSLLTETPR